MTAPETPRSARELPAGLRARLAPRLHPDHIPNEANQTLPTTVADWGSHAQPASRHAKPVAEAYLAAYLDSALRVGQEHGRRVALSLSVPIAVLLLAIAIVLTAIG
ncbi:hypothetical protein JOD54_004191 [Actinokineospora baliensis]|uniref:hypothetical protein n=1 Tax=Actinokineospora baliensis TaxID=547056 RepID=UPI0019590370|nr:hypothetical protein [Actinokineospora baliensis]MBM7773987.1 hypothetical protein [Actinokineospora baliensis]